MDALEQPRLHCKILTFSAHFWFIQLVYFYDAHKYQHDNIVVNVRTSTVIVNGRLKYLLCQYYWLKLKLQLRSVAHWDNIHTYNTKLDQIITNLIQKTQKQTQITYCCQNGTHFLCRETIRLN
jgi:hypothetical protein